MADKPKTVPVEALQAHTYDGKEYQVGDTYDIDEQYADSVAVQGKAVRTDRDKVAKYAAKAAEKTQKHQQDVAAGKKSADDEVAEESASTEKPAAAKGGKKRGTYARKDLKAK